jgi:hypothetical protein
LEIPHVIKGNNSRSVIKEEEWVKNELHIEQRKSVVKRNRSPK